MNTSTHVESALDAIRAAWDAVHHNSNNPFINAGARYNGKAFSCHAYSWDEDEDQPWNFKWGDFEVSWYKYCGKGMSMNRYMSGGECIDMMMECIAEVASLLAQSEHSQE